MKELGKTTAQLTKEEKNKISHRANALKELEGKIGFISKTGRRKIKMKVLIMSDSHGLTHEISIIKERHKQDVTAMIHCGDSELEKNDPYMNGMITVRGNCDRDSAYPNIVVEEIAGKRFLITHGHLYNVNMTLLNLSLKGEEDRSEYYLLWTFTCSRL